MTAPQLADRTGRLGTESAFEVLARATALAAQGRDIVNLGIGQPDFKTPDHIVEAATKALADGHHGYTPAAGVAGLREAVAADILRHRGVEVDPARVLIMPGGKPTMFFALMMFGEPGTEILYPNPGFPIYESVIRFSGATPVPIPLEEERDFAFSAGEVLEKITGRTRLIVLNSPANPTGGVTPKAEIDALAAGLERFPHVAILSDEIYSRLLFDGEAHTSLLAYEHLRDRTILLDGWSKTYAMTGWRLGYSVWPKAWVDTAERLSINCHSCVNASAQYAGIAALEGPQDAVETMRAAFERRRTLIADRLNAVPGVRCRHAGRRLLRLSQYRGHGPQRPRRCRMACWRRSAVAGTAAARASCASPAPTAPPPAPDFGAFGEGFLRFSCANSAANIDRAIDRMATGWLASPRSRDRSVHGLAARTSLAAHLRQFVARLHAHPVLRGSPADLLQSQRHIRGHTGPAVQHARQRPAIAIQAGRRPGHVPAHFLHAFADQFAQVRRVQHGAYPFVVAIVHRLSLPSRSVVVDQVHVNGFAILESEYHTPVA